MVTAPRKCAGAAHGFPIDQDRPTSGNAAGAQSHPGRERPVRRVAAKLLEGATERGLRREKTGEEVAASVTFSRIRYLGEYEFSSGAIVVRRRKWHERALSLVRV